MKEDLVLTVVGREIIVIYNVMGALSNKSWENHGIFICDRKKNIKKSEIISIIEYLYEEGFIDDRRTPYEVLTDNI